MATNILRLMLGLVLSTMAAMQLGAQEAPVFDAENLIVGTNNMYETNDGSISEIYLGPDGILHQFLWRIDTGQVDDGYMRIWVDQALRGVEVRFGDRSISTYPNDCNYTLGVCTFWISTSWGMSGTVTSSTELVGDILFRAASIDAEGFGNLPRLTCTILDERGVLVAMYSVLFSGNTRWFRRTTNLDGVDSHDALARVTSLCQQRNLVS